MTDASTPESIRRMIRRLAPVIYGPMPLTHWSGSEAVRFSGDPALGQRFVDLFSLRRG